MSRGVLYSQVKILENVFGYNIHDKWKNEMGITKPIWVTESINKSRGPALGLGVDREDMMYSRNI